MLTYHGRGVDDRAMTALADHDASRSLTANERGDDVDIHDGFELFYGVIHQSRT